MPPQSKVPRVMSHKSRNENIEHVLGELEFTLQRVLPFASIVFQPASAPRPNYQCLARERSRL